MDQAAFKQAVAFMFTDIRREIALAKASEKEEGKKALQKLGIEPGGGNIMAALALLCYTEFGGQLRYGYKKGNGDFASRRNFDAFFDDLGPPYKAFRAAHPTVYGIFRCGLAHGYYVKKDCIVYITSGDGRPGIGVEGGKYYFVIETYCNDLEKAFQALEKSRYPAPVVSQAKAVPVQAWVQTIQGPPVTTSGYTPPPPPGTPKPPPK